jgi:hypothetical protein
MHLTHINDHLLSFLVKHFNKSGGVTLILCAHTSNVSKNRKIDLLIKNIFCSELADEKYEDELPKAEMSPEGVLHYYDKWSGNGRYDKVSNNYLKF